MPLGSRYPLPTSFPSPFARTPHPIARVALDEVYRAVIATYGAILDGVGNGKMFGVVVVAAPDGTIGYLRGFGGMLDGSWHRDGFVGPVFDPAERMCVLGDGERQLAALSATLAPLEAAITAERAELTALAGRQAGERAGAQAEAAAAKTRRRAIREQATTAERAALTRDSQHAGGELRRLKQRHAADREAVRARITALEHQRDQLAVERSELSRRLTVALHDGYQFPDRRGQLRSLRELFAPAQPPTGAGDCAVPKLLVAAHRAGLRPIAVAEMWIGGSPRSGGRFDGEVYPACRGRCRPLVAHLLAGYDVEPEPDHVTSIAEDPAIVYEDAALIVIDKPASMLSVAGREASGRDCAVTRVARMVDQPVRAAHRLDLDVSGLMVLARTAAAHRPLQQAFANRKVTKGYVALLDGDVAGEAGTIELALRVDLDDRPRQIVDPDHGKPAITEWRVVAREAGPRGRQTRIRLHPLTGRTHQLRVHTAVGLAAPIVGDRLYGRASTLAGRLMLHAHTLAFDHPTTGHRIELVSAVPF